MRNHKGEEIKKGNRCRMEITRGLKIVRRQKLKRELRIRQKLKRG